MKNKLLILIIVFSIIILIGVSFLAAFAQKAPAKPIKIGALMDFTGVWAELGDRVMKGIELRLDEVNWKVAGRSINLIKEDGASNPTITMDKTKKLVEYDKVDILFGPIHGASTVGMAKYLQGKNLFFIPQGTQDIGLGSFGSAITVWGTSQGQYVPLGMYFAEKKGWQTITLGATDYSGGHKFLSDLGKGFEEKRGKVIQEQFFPPMTMDFGPYLSKIMKADGCMVWFGTGAEYANFRRQYKDFGFLDKMPLGTIMAGTVSESDLQEMGDLGIGSIGQNTWVLTRETPVNKKFVAGFIAKYKRDPGAFDAMGHEMASVALAGIEATGGDIEPQKLYRTILGLKLEVVGGPLRFTPEGFGIRNAYMCEVKKVGNKYRWIVDYVHPDLTYTKEEYEKGQVLK